MIKAAILLFLIVTLNIQANSQEVHSHSLEAGGGISRYGVLFYGGYVHCFTEKLAGKATSFYESGSVSILSYHSAGLDIAGLYKPVTLKNKFSINVKAGTTVSVDWLAEKVTPDEGGTMTDFRSIKWGALAGVEIAYTLSSKILLVAGGDQRFFSGKNWGHNRWFSYAGVRLQLP